MSPTNDITKEGVKLLIVEGRDEQLFFEAALRVHLGLTDIQVMAVGGKTRLTRSLEILVNDIHFPTIPSITPASKFRMLLHTNPTRERGECFGTRAGASEDM